MKKYPGHTADEINYYADHPLEHIKPKQVIVIAGTNDISEGYREKNLDETKIVANILNIARKAKFYRADKVYIEVYWREGVYITKTSYHELMRNYTCLVWRKGIILLITVTLSWIILVEMVFTLMSKDIVF